MFEAAAREVVAEAGAAGEPVEFLVQGTLYPDVVESGGGTGTANIKSHHNVGGLPDDLAFALVEPLRTLFKDEVRAVGEQLGLPAEIVWRQPFPGPGAGDPDHRRGHPRAARHPARGRRDRPRGAVGRPGSTATIWQCPVVLLADVRSVGVQGDGRTYGHPVVLRPVTSEDAMTADWARVPYDVLERSRPGSPTRCARSTGWCSTSPASRPAPSSGSATAGAKIASAAHSASASASAGPPPVPPPVPMHRAPGPVSQQCPSVTSLS